MTNNGTIEFNPKPKPRHSQPRRNQDRSKYGPHQGRQERLRRICQVAEGKLQSDPLTPEIEESMRAFISGVLEQAKALTEGQMTEAVQTLEANKIEGDLILPLLPDAVPETPVDPPQGG